MPTGIFYVRGLKQKNEIIPRITGTDTSQDTRQICS